MLLWQAPQSFPGSAWRIMSWYERYTNQRSIDGGDDPSSYMQNGSWIVDHFSAKGSNLITKFFDDHIVPDQEDKDLLAKVGRYGTLQHSINVKNTELTECLKRGRIV